MEALINSHKTVVDPLEIHLYSSFFQYILTCINSLKRSKFLKLSEKTLSSPLFSTDIRGGFMLNQLDFQKLAMRANIMEGNQYAANAAAAYGFDV